MKGNNRKSNASLFELLKVAWGIIMIGEFIMDLYVRNEEIADIDEVRKIYLFGWQNAFTGIVSQDYLDNTIYRNLENWAPPLEGSYILTDGKNILGTSSISASRDSAYEDWGEIISIYILPELIGKGYGHILFEFVKEKLLELGYEKIFLNVFEENMRARKFYEKHGFSWNNERTSINIGGKDLMELRYVYGREKDNPI